MHSDWFDIGAELQAVFAQLPIERVVNIWNRHIATLPAEISVRTREDAKPEFVWNGNTRSGVQVRGKVFHLPRQPEGRLVDHGGVYVPCVPDYPRPIVTDKEPNWARVGRKGFRSLGSSVAVPCAARK